MCRCQPLLEAKKLKMARSLILLISFCCLFNSMQKNSCLYSKNFRNVNTTNQLPFQKRSTTAKLRSTTATNASRNSSILYRLDKHWACLINKYGRSISTSRQSADQRRRQENYYKHW